MLCPYCGGKTSVYDTRTNENVIYRYRKCLADKYHRFKTVETIICEKEEAETDENGKQK